MIANLLLKSELYLWTIHAKKASHLLLKIKFISDVSPFEDAI